MVVCGGKFRVAILRSARLAFDDSPVLVMPVRISDERVQQLCDLCRELLRPVLPGIYTAELEQPKLIRRVAAPELGLAAHLFVTQTRPFRNIDDRKSRVHSFASSIRMAFCDRRATW